ncbi:MAG: hypothetical protein B6A08_16915 [Sorangiineae bacterium NIC37A_2]|nr:MAG: hypothetical protein B6A08_16915 [Sorangiineae bacterium NIC37A_2]
MERSVLSLEFGCDPVKAELAYFMGAHNSVRKRQNQARFIIYWNKVRDHFEKSATRIRGSGFTLHAAEGVVACLIFHDTLCDDDEAMSVSDSCHTENLCPRRNCEETAETVAWALA